MATISILIPVLNDEQELNATLASIHSTTTDKSSIEVIVVDDASDKPLEVSPENMHENVLVVRNEKRLGVGGTRHLAAEVASGSHLLLIDAHSRMVPGWQEVAVDRLGSSASNLVYNATCLGMGYGVEQLEDVKAVYRGATFCFYHPPMNRNPAQLLEGKWLSYIPKDDEQIPCLMGACYFVSREWFLKIGGLKMLRMWGSDEPYLALKTWLAGGEIRYLEGVKIGHKFRPSAPYHTPVWFLAYNKMRAVLETFEWAAVVWHLERAKELPEFEAANRQLALDWGEIQKVRLAFEKLTSEAGRSVPWLCEKFQIPFMGSIPTSKPLP